MWTKLLDKKVLITFFIVTGIIVLGIWGNDISPQLIEVLKALIGTVFVK